MIFVNASLVLGNSATAFGDTLFLCIKKLIKKEFEDITKQGLLNP